MKFIASLMIILCATTVSIAQTIKKEVTVTKGEDGKEEKIVKTYKIITTEDIHLDSNDKKDATIKKIMEILSDIEESDGIDSKVIVKTIDISDDDSNSSSYKVKILSDGEVKTIEGSEDIDLDKVKIKIKELSSQLGEDSDAIELVLKTLSEIEEKEKKNKNNN